MKKIICSLVVLFLAGFVFAGEPIVLSDNLQPISASITEMGTQVSTLSNSLSSVAFTGSYTNLSETPTNVSDFANDAGYLVETNLPTETWTFTLSNGTIITQSVVVISTPVDEEEEEE